MDAAVETAPKGRRPRKRRQVQLAAPPPMIERRYRQTIKRFDLWSVFKVSLCFYLCGLAVTMVAGIVLWLIASSFGVVKNVEDFMGELLSSKNFHFLSAQILEGAALIGLVLVALLVVVTVIAAAFYNLFAELVGGVEITVIEEDPVSGI
jgi:hypothetical protein